MEQMPVSYSVILGKSVKKLAALRGGGSALPGLFVEKIDADFVPRTLAQLPEGVVVISGTNGKTTTTKMVVELLEAEGMKVFTNRTGSNFVRGVAAALLGEVSVGGKIDADIAVLELDEAHAVKFAEIVAPRYSLLLNVLRDQLDRFGEIDTTAVMLKALASATTDTVVVNREDPRLLTLSTSLTTAKVSYFGLSPVLRKQFPSDDTMRGGDAKAPHARPPAALCTLEKVTDKTAQFSLDGTPVHAELQLDGVYNIYNAAAALALVKVIRPDLSSEHAAKTLSSITPAFGRGETITVNGQPIELVLVKNPSGFRLSLASFDSRDHSVMIAINDNYADGRDMSWLWDVDFDSLQESGVAAVSGVRAFDMALRLQYDEVQVGFVEVDLKTAVKEFVSSSETSPKRIFCSYTAMLAIRKHLAKYTHVEAIS